MVAGRLANRGPGEGRKVGAFAGAKERVHTSPFQTLSRDEASELLNVPTAQIQKAKVILRDGTPAVQALVESGKAPVTTAARVATTLT